MATGTLQAVNHCLAGKTFLLTNIVAIFVDIERARLLRRSQAVQRDLPRPTAFLAPNAEMTESGTTESPLAEADRLVQEELARLISHDAVAYPPAGSKVAGGKQNAPALENLSDEYLALARSEVDQELAAPNTKEKYEAFAAEFDQVWEQIQEEMKELQQIGLATQFSVSHKVVLLISVQILCEIPRAVSN